MKLKVRDNYRKEEVLEFYLEEFDSENIYLMARRIDTNTSSHTSSHILRISLKYDGIILSEGVHKNFGFSLDEKGRLKIRSQD